MYHSDNYAKRICLTGEEMTQMGWHIGDYAPTENFTLEIDTFPEKKLIRIYLTDVDGGDYLNDWEFDYFDTLQDLDEYGHLPCGIFQGNSLHYNDDQLEASESVQHSEVSEILGGISSLELKTYATLRDLNLELSGFSFSFEPKYL